MVVTIIFRRNHGGEATIVLSTHGPFERLRGFVFCQAKNKAVLRTFCEASKIALPKCFFALGQNGYRHRSVKRTIAKIITLFQIF